MADVKHKVERAAFGAAIDGILKYVNKDEEDREKVLRMESDEADDVFSDSCHRQNI